MFEEQREKKANHIKREKERKKARQKEKENKTKILGQRWQEREIIHWIVQEKERK